MKNVIMGCCLCLATTFFVLISAMQFTMHIKDRQLHSLAYQTNKNAITYIHNNKQPSVESVLNVMKESISSRMLKDTNVVVDVITLDIENGVLRVCYTFNWKQLNGRNVVRKQTQSIMIDQKKG